MTTIDYKGITFKVDGTVIYVAERTVNRQFKKSGVIVQQNYPEYKPIIHYDSKGYGRIVVSLNKKSKNCLVHDIIAIAHQDICGEWFDGAEVHHKDHNPSNNDPSNLVVLSRYEHSLLHSSSELTTKRMSSSATGRISSFKGRKHTNESNAKNSEKHSIPVKQYDMNHKLICVFKSCVECSKITGFPRSSINKSTLDSKPRFGYYWTR